METSQEIQALPTPTFELDLRRSLRPVCCQGPGEYFPELQAPVAAPDKEIGVRFPLEVSGLAFTSRGEIDDATGAVAVEFCVDAAAAEGGVLFRAWADYFRISVDAESLTVSWYFEPLKAAVGGLDPQSFYTVKVAWDCRSGLALELEADGETICRQESRRRWKAYQTKWCPFSIGGYLRGRRLVKWENSFKGHVRSVRLWKHPILPLGSAVDVRTTPAAALFEGIPGVRLLALDNPPVHSSKYAHPTIPDRLDDLKKTREVGRLDEVVRHCRTEFERFVALTEFVTDLYPHSEYWPSPKDKAHLIIWKPGHEIIEAVRAGEMGGMCGSYAHIMEEVFWAMGFEGRRIQVDDHSTFEAWSNQFDKWVELEADSACAGHAEFLDGTPLNAWDSIRVHQEAAADPSAYRQVRNMPHRSQAIHNTAVHMDHLYLLPKTRVVVPIGDYQGSFKRRGDYGWHVPGMDVSGNFFMYEPNGWVENPQELYWSCNRVRVQLDWLERGRRLTIGSEAVQTAHFEAFEASVDARPFSDSGGALDWELHRGVNILSIRTKNAFGVTGYPYRIEIWRG